MIVALDEGLETRNDMMILAKIIISRMIIDTIKMINMWQ